MNAEEYLRDRVQDQIDWYDSKSSKNQRWFKRLRLTEISAAATIPLLSGYIAQYGFLTAVVGILGAAVAVIAGALGLYQFENHWIEYRSTAESLKKEKILFLTGSDPFNRADDENYRLLVHRVESALSQQNTNWAQQLRPSEDENV